MKIGIVVSYISKNPVGLERYAYELVKNLIELDATSDFYIYTKKANNLDSFSFLNGNKKVKIIEVGWGKLWKDVGLFLAPKAEVYVFTGPQGPLLFHPKKNITIAYDLAYKYLNKGIRGVLKNAVIDFYSRRAFAIADRVVCLSHETKRELLSFFQLQTSKAVVIYPGFNNICLLPEEEKIIPPGPFFLFVGTIKERKNVLNILKGFEEFLKLGNDNHSFNLLISGKGAETDLYYKKLLSYIREKDIEAKVHFLGHVSDGELSNLYKRAQALVYPSLIEGFGLPLLEAMSCGLPVITSNLSSLKEVAADSALLVDPHSPKEIGEAMNKLVHDKEFRSQLVEKGKERAKQFSWNTMSHEFVQLITKISHE